MGGEILSILNAKNESVQQEIVKMSSVVSNHITNKLNIMNADSSATNEIILGERLLLNNEYLNRFIAEDENGNRWYVMGIMYILQKMINQNSISYNSYLHQGGAYIEPFPFSSKGLLEPVVSERILKPKPEPVSQCLVVDIPPRQALLKDIQYKNDVFISILELVFIEYGGLITDIVFEECDIESEEGFALLINILNMQQKLGLQFSLDLSNAKYSSFDNIVDRLKFYETNLSSYGVSRLILNHEQLCSVLQKEDLVNYISGVPDIRLNFVRIYQHDLYCSSYLIATNFTIDTSITQQYEKQCEKQYAQQYAQTNIQSSIFDDLMEYVEFDNLFTVLQSDIGKDLTVMSRLLLQSLVRVLGQDIINTFVILRIDNITQPNINITHLIGNVLCKRLLFLYINQNPIEVYTRTNQLLIVTAFGLITIDNTICKNIIFPTQPLTSFSKINLAKLSVNNLNCLFCNKLDLISYYA